MGGHMHLFSKEHLAASSGIVGASGPAGAGFALAAQYLRPGSIAVAFFGEGSMNQGMMMESLNLASSWNLPLLFVCKDDGWSITVRSGDVTGGDLAVRAESLCIPAVDVDGRDVLAVWEAANEAIERIRSGSGPIFLHARCVHFEGHFLGFQLIRMVRDPLREMPKVALPLTQSFLKPAGARLSERLAGLKVVLSAILAAARDPRREKTNDPIQRVRSSLRLDPLQLQELEAQIEQEIFKALDAVFIQEVPA
jgi:pyruvate dehydrogenase E1 component alpha subunit